MPEFPAAPVAPERILEDYLPRAFAEVGLPPGADELSVALGVKLDGKGGGEWVLRVEQGSVLVTPGSRHETAFTYAQSVVDWRGALWGGRGGVLGRQAAALFRPDTRASSGALGGPPQLGALERLRALDGLIRMVVTGGKGGDWSLDLKLGPGAIPDDPSTTVTVSAEDAAAMEEGSLNPMEAFMAGRIQVAGDVALMLQMQAIQMGGGQ